MSPKVAGMFNSDSTNRALTPVPCVFGEDMVLIGFGGVKDQVTVGAVLNGSMEILFPA